MSAETCVRWMASIVLLYWVFEETGFWSVTIVLTLFAINNELQNILRSRPPSGWRDD